MRLRSRLRPVDESPGQASSRSIPVAGIAEKDGCVLASRQLPFRRPDLSIRQSAAETSAATETRQAAAARALGNNARSEFHLCAFEPADQSVFAEYDLCHRTWSWRARTGGEYLSRRHV